MKISSPTRCAPSADLLSRASGRLRDSLTPRRVEQCVCWTVWAILLISYWLTIAPTVSYWDCPEYVAAAWRLEIGHPPGNPVWMLVERVVTMLAPAPRYAALAVNLSSGLFTAFAGFFLAGTIFQTVLWIFKRKRRRPVRLLFQASVAAACGGLAFGWSDSAWFSAVEAEVYAMSIFMTALCVRLMAKWAATEEGPRSWRLLILIAYLFGLSIGIHQLNLLCIPALAAIWGIKRNIRRPSRVALLLILSLLAVAFVLFGIMPASITLAAQCELFAVNTLGLPLLSGVWLYLLLLGLALLLAIVVTGRPHPRPVLALSVFPAFFMSGMFIFGRHFAAGLILSAVASILMVAPRSFVGRRLNLCVWMLTMILAGYSAYALIPIRGGIPFPSNASMPGDPFSFAAYQAREQYGSNPLFYGATPYSRPLYEEDFIPSGSSSAPKPRYVRYRLEAGSPVVRPMENARFGSRYSLLSEADSAEYLRHRADSAAAYIVTSYRATPALTPELNAFFPRITSRDPSDLAAYRSWIGMDTSTMERVEISETVDSAGNPAGRIGADGRRHRATSFRPGPLQHAMWLASYQTGYMYLRYLMWNFSGRQNDIPSQGEVQHGNFITGFPAIDNAMLGAEEALPPWAGSDNPGRNRYFMLPFLLGIAGIFRLIFAGRRGKQACGVIAILFVMTGLAIVVYLNQGPGEARERDYSFLGSFWAFAIWIGFGSMAVVRAFRSYLSALIPFAIICWMGFENFDDHDRSHRTVASTLTSNVLSSLDPDAVLFVDGDNFTFPFWYAIEVEGVRPDVRIVNLAYLQLPDYAANLLKDWRDSKALPSELRRGDVIWGALLYSRIDGSATDTLHAVDALRKFRLDPEKGFPARYVRLATGERDSLGTPSTKVYDMVGVSRSGSSLQLDFGRLMMFNILAANAASDNPRPVYWLRTIRSDGHIRLSDFSSPWLYGSRFGNAASVTDSMLVREASFVRPPNPAGRSPYMDRTPARQIASQRWALIRLARRLLDNDNLPAAERILRLADLPMGEHYASYGNFREGDSLHNARLDLANILIDVADRLQSPEAEADSSVSRSELERLRRRAPELKARGIELRRRADEAHKSWIDYRRALPPRLRSKMAPTD